MQWDIDGSLVWLITTFISTINLERAVWKQVLCPELTGVKMIQHSQPESIQAIVTAALTGQGKDYIKAIPCSHQAIESFVSPVHDSAQVVCKSMTMPDIVSDSGSSHGIDLSWNPNCMNTLEWVRVEVEDPAIHDLIQRYGNKRIT